MVPRRVSVLHLIGNATLALAAIMLIVALALWMADPDDVLILFVLLGAFFLFILGAGSHANARQSDPRNWSFTRSICRECGYSLTGNVSGRCPECGTPIEWKKDADA